MRFLVLGGGAIGTYVGGSLALVGNEVSFLERPETAALLSNQGMSLEINGRIQSIPVQQIYSSAGQALSRGNYEAIILAVKSYDTQNLLNSFAPYTTGLPPLLCLQNGVENEAIIGEHLGKDRVIAGTVTSAVSRPKPGSVRLERLRGVGIANSQQLSSQLAGIFTDAGLRARLYPDANNMKWSKMLTNLLGNATSAILGMTPREIFSDPQLYHLEITQLRETLQVMDALRIRVVNLPGTPTKILAWAVRRLPEMLSRPLLTRAIGSGRGGKMPSFYLDLQFGTGRSEVDYLNGAVVRAGKKTGTQTPVSLFLNETLLAMVAGSLPILEFDHQPGKLLARYTQQYD